MPGRKWTTEQRKEQSAKIKVVAPWNKATGPRSSNGKSRSALNAVRNGVRSKLIKEFRKIEKDNRGASLFDFEVQDKIEDARCAAILHVIDVTANGDAKAFIVGQAFIATQVRRTIRKSELIQKRWEEFMRFDTYSIRGYPRPRKRRE